MSLQLPRSGQGCQLGPSCSADGAEHRIGIDPKLLDLLPENIFFIESSRVKAIMQEMAFESQFELLHPILKLVTLRARPPISNFYVGAVGLTKAGNIISGVNIEFESLALNDSIHGEQCLIARLVNADEEGMICFAVNAPPCGHCRQFINELDVAQLEIAITDRGNYSLGQLLPFSFGPDDLGNATRLLQHPSYAIRLIDNSSEEQDKQLVELAMLAATRAYSPYSNCPSGVALRLHDGTTYRGSYIENAAHNPSLPPLQSALTGLVGAGKPWDQIETCVLVEKSLAEAGAHISQEGITRRLLSTIAPKARLVVLHIDTQCQNKEQH